MLFVAYYPEGAHLHYKDCEEVNDGLVENAVSSGDLEADSAFAAVLEVAKAQVWGVPVALSRCVFYPCTALVWVSGDDPHPEGKPRRPNPGAIASRVAEFRPRPLPFDPDGDHDVAILGEVIGRKITWINSISGEREVASLYPEGRNPKNGEPYNKQTKLEETSTGRRVLTFCATEGGFRSVALDTILEVK